MASKIKKHFKEYEQIIRGIKTVATNPLILQKEKKDRYFRYKGSLSLDGAKHSLDLELRTRVNCVGHHEFKIFAEKLDRAPCFRFESDGPNHDNSFDYVPLAERSIPTPHFHLYNSKGDMLAYQTLFLKNENNVRSVRYSPAIAFKHFSEESPVVDIDGKSPNVLIEGELNLPQSAFDPMEALNI